MGMLTSFMYDDYDVLGVGRERAELGGSMFPPIAVIDPLLEKSRCSMGRGCLGGEVGIVRNRIYFSFGV